MAGAALRLLVIFVGISHLLCLNAIPITRLGRIMHEPQVVPVLETTNIEEHRNNLEGSMKMELNDYPGSGANHRHTPWPSQLKSCADC
ncbi:uncharacterized protein LOC126673910 [Mercurialis annua]|uniref:uncharacterized protein LOC126673910 n=1 Tax=Mercurialis annua TaxID=3986 RepID=UPI00215E3EB8|nr:uncharacterized protein LOC126673910 [Mercurialis annua]